MEQNGMNVFQANICLLCVTFCWSTEVILFACIPDTVSPFATTCITSLVGGILLFLCFARKVIEAIKKHGKRLFKYVLSLAAMNTVYNLLYIFGLRYFDVSTGAFTISITAVACTLVQALIITPAVAFHYPDVDAVLFFISVLANGSLFPIGFSIPFIIMLQEELGFSPLSPGANHKLDEL